MKPELKKRWVDALRSGKYIQDERALNTGKGFCCLGVACEVFKDDVGLEVRTGTTGEVYYDGGRHSLPASLQSLLEITMRGTLTTKVGHRKHLTELNDLEKMTFDQIADVIDEQF